MDTYGLLFSYKHFCCRDLKPKAVVQEYVFQNTALIQDGTPSVKDSSACVRRHGAVRIYCAWCMHAICTGMRAGVETKYDDIPCAGVPGSDRGRAHVGIYKPLFEFYTLLQDEIQDGADRAQPVSIDARRF